ncbi:GGDEF domain-containing protein [Acidaminobacter sp. JC074]|uniref:GGDEF domain-containing protein n=1 Tax=Acidaminobacter sp. JC074 TaxID=2530199 RepID=UPI001F0D6987|nr:GGDEF domain-containing protein [Acidaminobacter sp. JC074]MCH4889597.1 GGDEF domain-containing protein [Acidaminobacter sp. JC074]
MSLIFFFTHTYRHENHHIKVKAELTAVMLLLICFSLVLEVISSTYLNPSSIITNAVAVLAFAFVLVLLKKGKLIVTGNLFVIAGLAKLIEFFPMNYTHQFYLQSFLGMLVAVAIYTKAYQLIATISYTLILNFYRLFFFAGRVNPGFKFEIYQACLGVFLFAVAIFFYDRVIKDEILINKRTKKLSETDQLTRLKNRQYFDLALQKEILSDRAYELALIDIDYFKRVNDTYGHHVGDQVLKTLGELMKKHFTGALVSRWGGEEFAVIGTNKDFGLKLTEFKDLVEAYDFGLDQNITLSIGCIKSNKMSYDDVLRLADKSLYEAKENGRNCIVYYERAL